MGEGLAVMYVTEDTTRADPDTLRQLYAAAIRAGATRVCISDTVGHATPAGAAAVTRFIAGVVEQCGGGVGIDWHGHRDRDLAVMNSIAAIDAGATRVHGAAIGIGERVGNTPMDTLIVNLVLMGYIERDLSALVEYCDYVARVTGVPIPANYPIVGRDAFRTATGVHAAAVIKAFRKQDRDARRRGLLRRAGQPGRTRAGDRGRPDVGPIERGVLAGEARLRGDRRRGRSDFREGQGVGVGAGRGGDPPAARPARCARLRRGLDLALLTAGGDIGQHGHHHVADRLQRTSRQLVDACRRRDAMPGSRDR